MAALKEWSLVSLGIELGRKDFFCHCYDHIAIGRSFIIHENLRWCWDCVGSENFCDVLAHKLDVVAAPACAR